MKKNFVAAILFYIFFLVFLSFIFLLWGIYLPKNSSANEDVVFDIEKGSGLREISLKLEEAGLIKWAPLFQIYALVAGRGGKLQAGSYSLNSSMNMPEISEKFARGEVIKNFFTVIEGWSLRDIGQAIEGKEIFQANELWRIAGFPAIDYSKANDLLRPHDFSQKFAFLKEKPANSGLEGYLFPDTYEIGQRKDPEEIIEIMLANFDKKITLDLRAEADRQAKTIFEIITMASLIEKEVKTKEDKELVSGILWKRIKIGMPLQVDATISYITGRQGTKISIGETQTDSPFNTYRYRGLPAGPISNPGIESIKAALYPKESSYLYYLSSSDGTTIFSRTLEEHNIAKAKYLKEM